MRERRQEGLFSEDDITKSEHLQGEEEEEEEGDAE